MIVSARSKDAMTMEFETGEVHGGNRFSHGDPIIFLHFWLPN